MSYADTDQMSNVVVVYLSSIFSTLGALVILGVQKLTRSGLNGFRRGTFERQSCLSRGL